MRCRITPPSPRFPVLLADGSWLKGVKFLAQCFAAVCAVCFVAAAVVAHAEPRAKHVFIVSFDGGKPAVMRRSPMPTLFGMVKAGAATWNAQTVAPSITLVSHTSMLTGVGPEKHHVLWNDWIPSKGLVKVPTVFQLAKEHGVTTALFAGKKKFKHLEVPGTLDKFDIPGYSSRAVAKAAAEYIVSHKPGLCFVHFADPDGEGHAHGWGSPEQVQAFADSDAALNVVKRAIEKAGIADSSVVIISADHGGHKRTHGTRSPEDMTIPWIAWGMHVRPGHSITAPVTTYDTAATALWLLDIPIPRDWDGKPVTSAFTEIGVQK